MVLTFTCGFALSQNNPPGTQQRDTSKTAKDKPLSEKDDVVRISVTLVQVDAVVTDRQGRQVTDLKPSDFEIFEDGRRQRISNFSYIAAQPDSPSPPKLEARSKVTLPIGPPARLRPDEVRRTVALVVDDLGLSFESTVAVRDALKKFVDQQMEPGDLVAIVRTGAGMGTLQQFTADRRQLYAAIERIRWNITGRGGIGAFAPIGAGSSGGVLFEKIDELRTEIYSVGTLGALNFVIQGLRELPGRKSVILFSDGFKLFSGAQSSPERYQGSQRVLDSLRRLTDLANRASVVVYTIDSRGLQTVAPTAADMIGLQSTDIRSASELPRQEPLQREERFDTKQESRWQELSDTQQGLEFLARETGGLAIRNTNDLARGVKRVLDDQKGYYLLGYIPEQATFRLEQGRRKFHKIAVKVKPAGLHVRSRSGFYGIAEEEARSAPRTSSQQVLAALMSPFASGDVNLKLTSLFGHEAKAGSLLRSLLHIEPRDLTFTKQPDGSHLSVIDVTAVTFSDNGQIVQQEVWTYTLRVPDPQFERLMKRGFLYTINLPVKKAGAYQLRVAVRDTASGRVGSANQFIEVPDIGQNRLTLSGLVVSGSDPAKSEPGQQAVEAAQQAASDKEGAVQDLDPLAGPAVRILHGGMDLDYGFLIYNAQLDEQTKRPQLETQILLLKDGKQIFTGRIDPLDAGDQTDLKHIRAVGRLRLGPDLTPGEYVLQVIVTDKLAKEKYRAATQWMDFELTK
jgi:VWFA-related protein